MMILEMVYWEYHMILFPGRSVVIFRRILGGDLHTLVLDRQGRVHSTGQGIHGVLGRGGLASTGEELDFREAPRIQR